MRRILLLYRSHDVSRERLTIQQHLAAMRAVPEAEIVAHNALLGAPRWLRHLRFDAVFLHTTLLETRWSPKFTDWKRGVDWVAELRCVKIALPQDDYDRAHVLDEWLDELGARVVCTTLGTDGRDALYPRLSRKAEFHEVLTGYIDDATAQLMETRTKRTSERALDIVYRASDLPFWFGSHGRLKHEIADAVLAHAPARGLACDISTKPHAVVLGTSWLDFLASGRATIGVEGGASALDRRGELRMQIEDVLEHNQRATFAEVSAQLPAGWDSYRFFAISPRHLEAVITRTAQILVEGHYSGVLEPEVHYISVRRDLSNLDDVLERARDDFLLESLANRAYEDVYRSERCSVPALTQLLAQILVEHAPGSTRTAAMAHVGGYAADAQAEVTRRLLLPLRTRSKQLLATGNLLVSEPALRQLVSSAARSSSLRARTTLRRVIGDVLCVGALARLSRRGMAASVTADASRRELVLSLDPARNGVPAWDAAAIERRLREGGWQVVWDGRRTAADDDFHHWALPRERVRLDGFAAVADARPDLAALALASLTTDA